jgi:hypothetical protein
VRPEESRGPSHVDISSLQKWLAGYHAPQSMSGPISMAIPGPSKQRPAVKCLSAAGPMQANDVQQMRDTHGVASL